MKTRAKTKSQAQSVRENSVGFMLKMLSTSLDAEMNKELKRLDLNLRQFAVLMTLSETEGLTQAEIGKKINVPGYATTRTLDALEDKRLVERHKDERSRRNYRIFLTDQGRAVVPELFAIVKKVNQGLLSVLSTTERKQTADILEKLMQARFGPG
ncbi:MAG: MarR family transcriptional regulator [Gammaproteobacteria bacterium]|nr:MarR family transcriptional regulator [Gammaproteobacteria bacterium]